MKYIKHFEKFFSKTNLTPEMPNLSVEDIISALDNQSPIVRYRRKDESFEDEIGQIYDIYETSIDIDGESIKILAKKNVTLPVLAIVHIDHYVIGANINSNKIYNKLKQMYKSSNA